MLTKEVGSVKEKQSLTSLKLVRTDFIQELIQ